MAGIVPIPLLDLKAQYASIRNEVRTALDRVIDSQRFILGPEVEALEREIASYSGCAYGIGVSSGTDALLASLMAIEIKPGDEVITSAYSFSATASTIVRLGARPVFADIDLGSYNIDTQAIEGKISSRTRAIIPVHLFGRMADMTPIMDIAGRHGLAVIEDAAQAIGSELHGRRAGSIGDLACFSFFPSKNLGGFGDGGMVTTNSRELADRLRLLRSHGFKTKYHNEILGGNFRLDEIQAAVLRVKLKYLDQWTEGRRRNAGIYRDALKAVTSVALPGEAPDSRHIFNQFVVRNSNRDALMAHLKERGIGCEIYYPIPLPLLHCFGELSAKTGDFPVSEIAARQTLALPIYPELTLQMIQSVSATIAAVLQD
jgi:dTDP-4-amino-4,6-dideoxygalactose transaminase